MTVTKYGSACIGMHIPTEHSIIGVWSCDSFVRILQVRVGECMEAVCQKAFASLYEITISRVRRIAKATSTSICAPVDRRGTHPRVSKRTMGEVQCASISFNLPISGDIV